MPFIINARLVCVDHNTKITPKVEMSNVTDFQVPPSSSTQLIFRILDLLDSFAACLGLAWGSSWLPRTYSPNHYFRGSGLLLVHHSWGLYFLNIL